VVTVAGEAVSADDFAHIFKKNNRDSIVTPEALDEYMELFIDFKLKVQAAEDLGMDTAASFVSELAGYRTQLARPYLVDNALLDALVQEAYDRTLEEVRASHLLVRLSAEATPLDTAAAWNKALALKERIASGEDFAAIARSRGGSDDPSVKENGGDLGWFSAFMMVHPFEDACYKASEGDLVGPVRTRFGYHIIQVTGRRPARGEVRVAHIMIRPDNAKGGAAEAKSKIDALAAELAAGADFAELARQHSDDQSSRTKGGELPQFGTGRMVESFEEAAFALHDLLASRADLLCLLDQLFRGRRARGGALERLVPIDFAIGEDLCRRGGGFTQFRVSSSQSGSSMGGLGRRFAFFSSRSRSKPSVSAGNERGSPIMTSKSSTPFGPASKGPNAAPCSRVMCMPGVHSTSPQVIDPAIT